MKSNGMDIDIDQMVYGDSVLVRTDEINRLNEEFKNISDGRDRYKELLQKIADKIKPDAKPAQRYCPLCGCIMRHDDACELAKALL